MNIHYGVSIQYNRCIGLCLCIYSIDHIIIITVF